MKALVTGGAGFIGSHVVEQLVARGVEVAVIDDLSNGKRENLPPAATLHEGTITDGGFVEATMAAVKPDVVCHLAAQVSVIESLRDPFGDAQRNILGSVNLYHAARRNGQPKIVYCSTGGAIYGEPDPADLPVDESYPCRPLSPYGISKYAAEHYLRMEGANHGQRWSVLRFSNVFGPRQDPHGEAGVVAIFTQRIFEDRTCYVFGDGEQTRDFVYVGDVARAVVTAALDDGRSDGEIVNIGTGLETTVNEVVRALEAAWGGPFKVEHKPARTGEVRRIALDVKRAGRVLGWAPEVAFRDGIARTVESFR